MSGADGSGDDSGANDDVSGATDDVSFLNKKFDQFKILPGNLREINQSKPQYLYKQNSGQSMYQSKNN